MKKLTHRPWQRYLDSLVLVIVVTLLSVLVHSFIVPTNLVMLYLLAVVIAAVRWGRGPAAATAVLGALAFDFFLVPPHLTFAIADTQHVLTFVGLLVVGLVISTLAAQLRSQIQVAQQQEAQAVALYDLSRDLAAAADLEAILRLIVDHVGRTLSCEDVIFLVENGSQNLASRACSPGFMLGEDKRSLAEWAFKHKQAAGRYTDTIPAADSHYLPLETAHGVIGVLGVQPLDPHIDLTPAERRLLASFASQAAQALERARLAEAARQAQVLAAAEKLQTALFNSISHDLRTPLASITGVISSLHDDQARLDEATRQSLIETASEEAGRLNRLVENLLDMTRIEAGAMTVRREACDVQDLVGAALQQVTEGVRERPVSIDLPDDLPLVPMDFVLIVRVLVNLLDNALKYSPPDAPLEVRARQIDAHVEISVTDRGAGIPPQDLARVFDKFYRVQRPGNVSGTGLGLSICKGIVEAHGGRIWARNRDGGGTIIALALPLENR